MTDNNTNGAGSKIKSPAELVEIISSLKAQGRCVVHSHGVFDLIHPGHIRHLEAAKREGDVLVVTLTPDKYVGKGPGRPVFNQRLRAESLAALQCVDYVAINEWPTAIEVICLLRPNVYAQGGGYARRESDLTDELYDEQQAILSVGGRIHFTNEIMFSSTHLINNYFSTFPPETENWLKAFREQHTVDEVIGYLEDAIPLKALVVGEAIIDEYVFCHGLGKATKDPILAFQYCSTEMYAGGSLAVANHLAGFCDQVGLITLLGESERREDFVRQALLPNVRPCFVTQQGGPTIHKRRFVDNHTGARMFELYVMDDAPLEPHNEVALVQALADIISEYDIVIVADYGHGMMTPAMIAALCDTPCFLAVNTQANAGNRGFNAISKYPHADYVCLAMHEVALETRLRDADWRDSVLEVTKKIDCPRFTVTRGRDGSVHYGPECGFTEVPALATQVVDRVGAGDAVLAVTSLLVAQDAPWDIVGFVGNLAGAQMVAELGNRVSVSKASIARHAISLMK
jgi:rfaE bifunctional protein nucleotidyltransferase chain/domain